MSVSSLRASAELGLRRRCAELALLPGWIHQQSNHCHETDLKGGLTHTTTHRCKKQVQRELVFCSFVLTSGQFFATTIFFLLKKGRDKYGSIFEHAAVEICALSHSPTPHAQGLLTRQRVELRVRRGSRTCHARPRQEGSMTSRGKCSYWELNTARAGARAW